MANVAYEFLVRWDHETGALKGAYIKTYDTTENTEGQAQAVAVAGSTGFPLADILTSIEIGAILAMEAAQAALAAEIESHNATKAVLPALPPVDTSAQ